MVQLRLTPGGRKPTVSPGRIAHLYLDGRRRVLHCLNEAARQLVRDGVPLTSADLARQPLFTLAGDLVAASDMPLVRAYRDQAAQEAVFVLPGPGGTLQHLTWHAAPLNDARGAIMGVLGTVRLAPPEPDWQQLAGMAHDLRTPLQALRLLTPMLEQTLRDAPGGRELLERVRSSTDRALAIGLDLLEWCRGPMQQGRPLSSDWFALAPFASALAAEQFLAAERKQIPLLVDLRAAEGLEVHTDAIRLGRLIANLLTNAVRYTSKGQVRFTATWREKDGGREALVLSVIDTGSGIAEGEGSSIFAPFERGKKAKQGDSSGSGLGLAVVERLVDELGLALEVYSEYGSGSKFDLLLPAKLLRQATGKKDEG